jgi:hypothetical protein
MNPDRQINVSAEQAQELEREAVRLNLTVSAYIRYLQERQRAGISPQRFDRVVSQVFGRYGRVMRLAK